MVEYICLVIELMSSLLTGIYVVFLVFFLLFIGFYGFLMVLLDLTCFHGPPSSLTIVDWIEFF